MITREQIADLQPGDVVEVVETIDGDDFTTRGPLRASKGGESLTLGDFSFRTADGAPAKWFHTITVVSRAPRPLYVNHPRTKPVPGDVVRSADVEGRSRVWVHLPHAMFQPAGPWVTQSGNEPIRRGRSHLPARLRLLVDGETGMAVTS